METSPGCRPPWIQTPPDADLPGCRPPGYRPPDADPLKQNPVDTDHPGCRPPRCRASLEAGSSWMQSPLE